MTHSLQEKRFHIASQFLFIALQRKRFIHQKSVQQAISKLHYIIKYMENYKETTKSTLNSILIFQHLQTHDYAPYCLRWSIPSNASYIKPSTQKTQCPVMPNFQEFTPHPNHAQAWLAKTCSRSTKCHQHAYCNLQTDAAKHHHQLASLHQGHHKLATHLEHHIK